MILLESKTFSVLIGHNLVEYTLFDLRNKQKQT